MLAPAGENVPEGHASGVPVPAAQENPAGHVLPEVVPPGVGQYFPGGHMLPAVIPGIGQYCPMGH